MTLRSFFKIVKSDLNPVFSGFIHNKYPMPNWFAIWKPKEFRRIFWETCISLYPIKVIYEYICKFHKIDLTINNIDVIKLLDEEFQKFHDKLFETKKSE